MTAQHLAETQLIDGVSAQHLLEGLGRVYRWLLLTDAHRRILWMSEELAAQFGEDGVAVGSDAVELIPKLPRPEQVFSLRSELRHRSHLIGAPLEFCTPDGDSVEAEVTVLKIEPVEPGDPLLLAVARPVADAPRLAPARYAVIDRAPLAALFVDADGFVEHANPAAERLTGRRVTELVGSPAALFFAKGPADVERLAQSLSRGESQDTPVDVHRPDGRQVPCVLTVSADADSDDRILFVREDTGNARIVADLRRENEDLEHCVNALAHDLRSPLVALLGFSRLLRQEYGAGFDDTGHHFLDRIEQAGRTMEGLVHDVLELSRIGQSADRPGMVDPRGVLVQLKAELKPQLDAADIELRLPEPPPGLVYCDRTRLYQLFSNLIGNAIAHMGACEARRIAVSVMEIEEGHHLEVRDNGRGIEPEHIGHIFDPFYSASRREGRAGAGMGLAIVKKIAEKYGGRAWVESAPGEGSAFHVVLPRH
jgi:PAS domain S-box-containing protein